MRKAGGFHMLANAILLQAISEYRMQGYDSSKVKKIEARNFLRHKPSVGFWLQFASPDVENEVLYCVREIEREPIKVEASLAQVPQAADGAEWKEILEKYHDKCTTGILAVRLGKSRQWIRQKLRLLGLRPKKLSSLERSAIAKKAWAAKKR